MASLREEWFLGLDDPAHLARVVVRLVAALLLGAILGYEREQDRKPAGLRTHMLVTVGAALFILAPIEAGVKLDQLSRVIQGLATGIGFLGAGAILKLSDKREIHGLTTAANIWVAAAVGLAVGMGLLWPAFVAVFLACFVLRILRWFDRPNRRS
jgi:putative Mg2+ transporter-C (MgtC) family protein